MITRASRLAAFVASVIASPAAAQGFASLSLGDSAETAKRVLGRRATEVPAPDRPGAILIRDRRKSGGRDDAFAVVCQGRVVAIKQSRTTTLHNYLQIVDAESGRQGRPTFFWSPDNTSTPGVATLIAIWETGGVRQTITLATTASQRMHGQMGVLTEASQDPCPPARR